MSTLSGGTPHRRVVDLLLVVGATVGFSAVLELLKVPNPVLFASLAAGVVHSLTRPTELRLPRATFRIGQGLIGVITGSMVPVGALVGLGDELVPIIIVTVTTVWISLLAGWLLARRRDVSLVTGVFAFVAGGASGVVAMAHDLGADEQVVTVVQYLRVLMILVTLPIVAGGVFHSHHDGPALAVTESAVAVSYAYAIMALAAGLFLAHVLRATSSVLLAPLAVAIALHSMTWLDRAVVPHPLEWLAYGLVGVQVGLRFRPEKLRSIARMLPGVVVVMIAMIAFTAASGAVLAATTSTNGLTAYLATTPGGLFAVLAIAADSGSDVTYVMAMQILRLLVVLGLMPLLAKVLR